MLSILGRSQSACDRVSRRQLLQAGGAGLLGLSVPRLLAAESVSRADRPARARSVIFLFLYGGPSQLETFDMKPDAADTVRGPFRPIACRTPELRICEKLPQLAKLSDKYSVIRTMSHDYNDHSGGGHYLQTGRRWHVPIGGGFNHTPRDWPSMGSVTEYLAQHAPGGLARDLPAYAVLPNMLGRIEQEGQYHRPGEHAGWLGRAYNPLTTRIDRRNLEDNPYWRDCTDEELTFAIDGLAAAPELTLDRNRRRMSLVEEFDAGLRRFESRRVGEYSRFQERALSLVTSDRTRAALDIRREPDALRDRYGRHLFGQSVLMARRLVEAGMRFVTVHYDCCDGYSWDSHRNSADVDKHLLPTTDQATAALLEDLEQRGLLDETLVVCLGEMGRTPKANSDWGRDHWSTLFCCLLAGAGIRGGTVYGTTDGDAAYALDRPVSPEDLAATIYTALGIDPEVRLPDAQGRPSPIVEGGEAVEALFG
ncbi:MAG: DUF1501 domain-containing protein [Planctomyces sp.]|nr:DUF1501 domain-containing protein [Planctomyces sp.]